MKTKEKKEEIDYKTFLEYIRERCLCNDVMTWEEIKLRFGKDPTFYEEKRLYRPGNLPVNLPVKCGCSVPMNKNKEEECIGYHCKCMNLDKLCPNKHYADCKVHNPTPSPQSPLSENGEEVNPFSLGTPAVPGYKTINANTTSYPSSNEDWEKKFYNDFQNDNEVDGKEIADWWLARTLPLAVIEELEEKVRGIKVEERAGIFIPSQMTKEDCVDRGYELALSKILSLLSHYKPKQK